ncbi:MAG: hypothetical protein AAFY38_02090 [Pseudomonadota bacterium]
MQTSKAKSDGRVPLVAVLSSIDKELLSPLGDQGATNPAGYRRRVTERAGGTSDHQQKE